MIWNHNGARWERVSIQKAPVPFPAVLAAPGPSLAAMAGELAGPGRFVLALNTAYPTIPRPDAWMGMDQPLQYRPQLTMEPFPKYWRGSFAKVPDRQGVPLMMTPSNYFLDVADATHADAIFQWRDNSTPFVWYRLTFQVAVHLLLRMGYRRLFFAGCDFSQGYCHQDVTLEEWQTKRNDVAYNQVFGWFRAFVRRGRQLGIECYSLTPGSPINDFCHFVEWDDFEKDLRLPKETAVEYVQLSQ